MFKNKLSKQGFPISGCGMHFMQGHTCANGCKGVTGKIQVGHGVNGKGIVCLCRIQVVAEFHTCSLQLTFPYTCHHSRNHFLIRHTAQIVLQQVPCAWFFHTRLVQKLAQEFFSHLLVGNRRRYQFSQIHHFYTLFTQTGCKCVMFPLGFPKIGNIIKQQAFQIFGHQVFQFRTRTVQHDFFQPSNFGGIMDSRFQTAHSFYHVFLN